MSATDCPKRPELWLRPFPCAIGYERNFASGAGGRRPEYSRRPPACTQIKRRATRDAQDRKRKPKEGDERLAARGCERGLPPSWRKKKRLRQGGWGGADTRQHRPQTGCGSKWILSKAAQQGRRAQRKDSSLEAKSCAAQTCGEANRSERNVAAKQISRGANVRRSKSFEAQTCGSNQRARNGCKESRTDPPRPHQAWASKAYAASWFA